MITGVKNYFLIIVGLEEIKSCKTFPIKISVVYKRNTTDKKSCHKFCNIINQNAFLTGKKITFVSKPKDIIHDTLQIDRQEFLSF